MEQPYHGRVQDPEIVTAVVAGDPAGLAAAYEAYGPALYTYCRSLLRSADDAGDALHDTFVVASQKLDGLRDPERLRPWLYAVARNECLRILRARTRSVALEDGDDVTDDSADVTVGVQRQELRELVRSAFAGLNAGDREVLDLSMRHELQGPELGAALGVSANHAHALLSRARGQMEIALGALLVARAGSEDCPQLADVLQGWDGRFNTLIRKRVNRHIEACDVCKERRRGELRPAMLLGLGPILLPPPEVRAKILRLCGEAAKQPNQQRPNQQQPDQNQPNQQTAALQQAALQYAHIARRAEPFDTATGFPTQLDRRRRALLRRRATVVTTIAVLLLLIGATAASAALHVGPFARVRQTEAADLHTAAPPTATFTVTISTPTTPPTSTATTPSPTQSPTAASTSPSPHLVVTTAPTQPQTTSTTPARSQSPTPPRSPSPTLPLPSVSITGTPVYMDGPRVTGAFAITAEGGTVNYTVALPANPDTYGDPSVSPASGTLTNGQNVVVYIRITNWTTNSISPFTLTVNPGNIQVTVYW